MPQTEWTRFYLQPDGSLGPAPPAEGAAPLAFTADPRNPVPTIGGALSSGEPVMRGGAYDQRTGPKVFGAKPPYAPLAPRPGIRHREDGNANRHTAARLVPFTVHRSPLTP